MTVSENCQRCCCLSAPSLHHLSIRVQSSARNNPASLLRLVVLRSGAPLSMNTWQNWFESWACDWSWRFWACSVGDSRLPSKTKSVVTQCLQKLQWEARGNMLIEILWFLESESRPVGCCYERNSADSVPYWDERMQIVKRKCFKSDFEYWWGLCPHCCTEGVRCPFLYAMQRSQQTSDIHPTSQSRMVVVLKKNPTQNRTKTQKPAG